MCDAWPVTTRGCVSFPEKITGQATSSKVAKKDFQQSGKACDIIRNKVVGQLYVQHALL